MTLVTIYCKCVLDESAELLYDGGVPAADTTVTTCWLQRSRGRIWLMAFQTLVRCSEHSRRIMLQLLLSAVFIVSVSDDVHVCCRVWCMVTLGPALCVSPCCRFCMTEQHACVCGLSRLFHCFADLGPPYYMQMCLLASSAMAAGWRGQRRTSLAPPASSSGRSLAWRCSSTGPWC